MATRDKLKRFLCTSAEEDHEVPRKQLKIDTEDEDNEATSHANEDENRREFQVITYTGFFSIILCHGLS